uniref:No apical meristem-associated C-terminal domain-containing protein n=1 Tax=Oryza glaberrima TaxID=4538 RepID=I1PCJ4_ORYGL
MDSYVNFLGSNIDVETWDPSQNFPQTGQQPQYSPMVGEQPSAEVGGPLDPTIRDPKISALRKILNRPQNGMTITQATTLYKSEEKKTFSLMHCWEILHHHPKWNDRSSQKKHKANVDPLVIPSARTNSREFHCSPDINISDPLVRPPGRKVEKAKCARGDTSSCSSESSLVVIALTNMWSEKKEMSAQSREERNDRLGEVISLEKERLKVEK